MSTKIYSVLQKLVIKEAIPKLPKKPSMKDNPNAAVWIGLKDKNRMKQLEYSAAASLLKSLAKRAGIKKRIYFYLFRHTRIDESIELLTEAQQCMMFGWIFGSRNSFTGLKKFLTVASDISPRLARDF